VSWTMDVPAIRRPSVSIEPEIVHRDAFVVAGMCIATRPMARENPALWRVFVPCIDEVVAIAVRHVSYGGMANFDPVKGTLDYMAAVAVSSAMARRSIPTTRIRWWRSSSR